VFTIIYVKVYINGNTHGEVMSDIGVKQGCPLTSTLFGLYIDELETYLDEVDWDSPCPFNMVVATLLYVVVVVLLSKSRPSLQKLQNKPYEGCTSSSLEVNISKTKTMIIGHNARKLNHEAFYLDKDQIGITQEYKYLGTHFYSHGYFEPLSRLQRMVSTKALVSTLRNIKKKRKSQRHMLGTQIPSIKGLNWCFQLSLMALKFGEAIGKTLIGMFLRKP
jgi:hypothetical protein